MTGSWSRISFLLLNISVMAKERSKEKKLKRLREQLVRMRGTRYYDGIAGRIATLENTK